MNSIAKYLKTGLYTVVFMVVLSLTFACNPSHEIRLVTPSENRVLNNNMPTFSWKATGHFTSFEIWIDNRLMDTVAGNLNLYIPFPLSYGKHCWKVVGKAGKVKVSSPVNQFSIEDRPLGAMPENYLLLRENWRVIAASQVAADGSRLSSGPDSTSGWVNTSVPATVLTALVRNGIYPNPYVGLNNMLIPDCNDDFNQQYQLLKYSHIPGKNPWKTPYWFCTMFDLNEAQLQKYTWLNFGEINYKASVWLNGQCIADTSQMIGMEQLFRFNISSIARPGTNYLAVCIYPVNHPGKPDPEPIEPFGDPGTNMADGIISKDYTKWDMLGWDWQPPVRDRNMGLVEDVFVEFTNAVEFDNLYITSRLNLPDTTQANLTISADLINHDATDFKGTVTATITGDNKPIIFQKEVQIKGNQKLILQFDEKNEALLQIKNPRLWWPLGYGQPNLYHLSIELKNGTRSITKTGSDFGIRQVETYIGDAERVYKINGRAVYCKGGNWVIDMMLNWTAQRYADEINLTKNSNLNILRIWGPTGAPPESFYQAADEQGIMLWQDFLNDYWGTFKNTPGFIPDEKLFERATRAIVKKYRNHPSLVIWCGGNEGPNPREKLITGSILPQLDGRDTKHYLRISNGDGLHGGGPYHTMEPDDYFTASQLKGFSSEIGPSGMPVYESIIKFMPDLGKNYDTNRFPVNGDWAYHDATDRASDNRKFSFFDKQVRNYYGEPATAQQYFDKSQLVNYDVYRASIESVNRFVWDKASGIALWKSNSSWPSLTWQIYDWYLQAHAGFYGTKKAAEPLHIQFNRDSNTVVILNASFKTYENATISASLYDENLKVIWQQSQQVQLPENKVTSTGWTVPVPNKISFLKLMVTNNENNLLTDNFYWLNTQKDFKNLVNLPAPKMETSVKTHKMGNMMVYKLEIKNSSTQLAFMIAVSLINSLSGHELLPAFYSDNYISLLPGEQKEIEIRADEAVIDGPATIQLKAYNSKEIIKIPIK